MYEPEVLAGVLAGDFDGEAAVDVYFCIRALTDGPDDPDDPVDPRTVEDASDDAGDVTSSGTLDDPTSIPTGRGPSGRVTLALVAFVLLALGGSMSLLVWSRSA